jgi:type I restriction enzyme, S subunit
VKLQKAPAKFLYRVVDQRAGAKAGELPLLQVSISRGVIRRDEITDKEARAEDLSNYKLCAARDIVINRMRAFQGALGISPIDGLVSPDYLVIRVGPETDARFLTYLFRSTSFVSEMSARLRGIGTTEQGNVRTPRINEDDLGRIPVRLPLLDTQRAIADYLDRETARIDALIAAKRRMVELLLEEEQRMLLNLIGDWRREQTWSLRQSGTTVLTGPFGTQLAAGEYVQGGIPVVNPTHITRTGSIAPDGGISVSEEVAQRLSRHRLRQGDIVMGRKGDVGRSAVVAVGQEGWLCGSDSIAIRTDPTRLSPQFLAIVLHVSLYRQQLDAYSTGAMMANVSESTLLDFRIPRPSLARQEVVLSDIDRRRSVRQRTSSCLAAGGDLLEERHKALITAAVTGQLDVGEVA